jgi:hypothetical protein
VRPGRRIDERQNHCGDDSEGDEWKAETIGFHDVVLTRVETVMAAAAVAGGPVKYPLLIFSAT